MIPWGVLVWLVIVLESLWNHLNAVPELQVPLRALRILLIVSVLEQKPLVFRVIILIEEHRQRGDLGDLDLERLLPFFWWSDLWQVQMHPLW